jgi:predicted DNA-binding transcriptional regulator YafY
MPRIQHLQRNLLIISKIKSTPSISFKELTKHIEKELNFRGIYDTGTSRRTIQRDIQNIRTEFGIDILYNRKIDGYSIRETTTPTDIDRFLEAFDILTAINAESGIADFILTEQHRPQGTKYLYPLIQAIKNSSCVAFSYLKFWDESATERLVEPYSIKEFKGRWYLIGRTAGIQDMKIYGLDRITELEISDNSFKKDKQINIAQLFQDCYGIYSTENFPVEDVILSFDKGDGNYLKSLPLHHSQKIVKDDDQAFVIKLHLRITPDFVMEILSRGWSLKVIQPDSLRKQVCEICRSAAERNQ